MPTLIESGAREERKAPEKRSHSHSGRMNRLCGKSKELWEDPFNGDACPVLLPLQRTARKHFTRRNCRKRAAGEVSGLALVRPGGARACDTKRLPFANTVTYATNAVVLVAGSEAAVDAGTSSRSIDNSDEAPRGCPEGWGAIQNPMYT